MEEEIQGEEVQTIFKSNDEEDEKKSDVRDVTVSENESEELTHDDVVGEAHALIDTFTQKLGDKFKLDNSVAHDLLKRISSSQSGKEALHQLDQLVRILEDLLAELNAVTLIGRYNGNVPVSVVEASDHTVTVFDVHDIPLEDEELLEIEQRSNRVKHDLVDFATRTHPDLALSFPSNT